MADNTLIEWTDATWNIITGCTLVDEGCRHCYAARLAATRLKAIPSRKGLARLNAAGEAKFTGEVRFNDQWLDQPLRWKKGRMIFVCAHGDLFHEAVPDDWIDKVFAVMALAPQHTFQVLTKRPERMQKYLTGLSNPSRRFDVLLASRKVGATLLDLKDIENTLAALPLPNVWLGTSISDQPSADLRIPDLLATPAAVRFLSVEPMLGAVDLTFIPANSPIPSIPSMPLAHTNALAGYGTNHGHAKIDWVICGGESGPKARPMHPDWARSLRDQCVGAGVAFHFKQWGEWEASLDRDRDDPDWRANYSQDYVDRGKSKWLNLAGGSGFHGERFHIMRNVGKSRAGRLLDGREWNELAEGATNA